MIAVLESQPAISFQFFIVSVRISDDIYQLNSSHYYGSEGAMLCTDKQNTIVDFLIADSSNWINGLHT